MRPRFHVPGVNAAAAHEENGVELPEDEAEHLVRVLRLGAGDEVDVFDGHGSLWRADVVRVGKKSASVRLLEPGIPARELGIGINLVISVLKGDKMDDVVRDAVMLGVTAIRPVVSERSEFGVASTARGKRVARWQRIAVSSAKQCGRAVVPPIHEVVTLPFDWQRSTNSDSMRVMCVEPSAALGEVRDVQAVPRAESVDVIVGPEGGWTASEVTAARDSGVILMSLGSRTLRADAVPIVALTALLTTWGELK